jgi:hypothetical protein
MLAAFAGRAPLRGRGEVDDVMEAVMDRHGTCTADTAAFGATAYEVEAGSGPGLCDFARINTIGKSAASREVPVIVQ